MILYWFIPKLAQRRAEFGCALSRFAYPLECRIPEPLARLMERLERC